MTAWTDLQEHLLESGNRPPFEVVRRRARRRTRQRRLTAAAVGVLATVVAVPALLLLPGGTSATPAPRPFLAPPADPVVRSIGPAVPRNGYVGRRWIETAWATTTVGWAAGTDCTADTNTSCLTVLARTTNGGATWTDVALSHAVARATNIGALYPGHLAARGSRVWLGDYTSTDGGKHFEPTRGVAPGISSVAIEADSGFAGTPPVSLAVQDPPKSKCAVQITLTTLNESTPPSKASTTLPHQLGIAWGPTYTGADGTTALEIANTPKSSCGPALPTRVATVTDGQSFAPMVDLPADVHLAAVYDRNTLWFLTAKTHQVLISTDGGRHLSPLPHSNIDDALPLSATTVLLTHNTGKQEQIFRSTDGGRSTSLVLTIGNGGFPPEVSVVDATTVTTLGPNGLFIRSTDAGKTWREAGHLR